MRPSSAGCDDGTRHGLRAGSAEGGRSRLNQACRALAKRSRSTFKAPAKAGVYPYLCTFPGHFAAGMKGETDRQVSGSRGRALAPVLPGLTNLEWRRSCRRPPTRFCMFVGAIYSMPAAAIMGRRHRLRRDQRTRTSGGAIHRHLGNGLRRMLTWVFVVLDPDGPVRASGRRTHNPVVILSCRDAL